MEVLYYISDCMIPFVILYLVGYGMCKKVDIFDSFIEGAKDGFLTVYKILPTLIGLMIGVGILRQSGFMEWLAGIFAPVVNILHFPGELLPLFIVKCSHPRRQPVFCLIYIKHMGPILTLVH